VSVLPPSGDTRFARTDPQFLCLASLRRIPRRHIMLEWKFRLVILLALAGTVAASLGSLIANHNYGW